MGRCHPGSAPSVCHDQPAGLRFPLAGADIAAYVIGMDIAEPSIHTPVPNGAETQGPRDARIRLEAESIARGQGDIDAGRGIELPELEAWFRALETDTNAPFPLAAKTRANI
jgi:hypothetical protein